MDLFIKLTIYLYLFLAVTCQARSIDLSFSEDTRFFRSERSNTEKPEVEEFLAIEESGYFSGFIVDDDADNFARSAVMSGLAYLWIQMAELQNTLITLTFDVEYLSFKDMILPQSCTPYSANSLVCVLTDQPLEMGFPEGLSLDYQKSGFENSDGSHRFLKKPELSADNDRDRIPQQDALSNIPDGQTAVVILSRPVHRDSRSLIAPTVTLSTLGSVIEHLPLLQTEELYLKPDSASLSGLPKSNQAYMTNIQVYGLTGLVASGSGGGDRRGNGSQNNKQTDHIKRPLNPFMVWSVKNRKTLAKHNPRKSNTEISTLLGQTWKAMSDNEKAPSRAEAAQLRQQHSVDNPNYKYKPRRNSALNSGSPIRSTVTNPARLSQRPLRVQDNNHGQLAAHFPIPPPAYMPQVHQIQALQAPPLEHLSPGAIYYFMTSQGPVFYQSTDQSGTPLSPQQPNMQSIAGLLPPPDQIVAFDNTPHGELPPQHNSAFTPVNAMPLQVANQPQVPVQTPESYPMPTSTENQQSSYFDISGPGNTPYGYREYPGQ